MNPELQAYLDAWESRRQREFENLMACFDPLLRPATRLRLVDHDTPGSVTGLVPASSVTTELVLASAVLAEPPPPALPIVASPMVAPAIPIDTADVVLASCSTECAAQTATMSTTTTLLPWTSVWSPASPTTSTTNTGKDLDAAATVIDHKDAHEFAIPLTVNPSTWYDHFSCAFLDASHCPEYFVNGVHMHKQHGQLLYTSGLYLEKFSGRFREFLRGCESFQWTNPWYINYHLSPWLPFECKQDGMPSVSHMIQSLLSLSARPKLWAHPSGDPLCKLLSLGYQDFSLLLAFHLFDTAAGHVHHMTLQSDRVEIYQLITQPGRYFSLFLQTKLSCLSSLTQIDTGVEEKGVHPNGEVITLNSKTTLAAPDSSMPQYTRSTRLLTEVKPPDGTHALLLYHHIWTYFGEGSLIGILLQGWLHSNFARHITQYGFDLFQWNITWSHHLECSGKASGNLRENLLHDVAEIESDAAASESKTQKEAIDFKELKRIDQILMTLQRKLPPAPPPPPYPEGYVPPSASEEKAPDDLLASEVLPPTIDPIIDQGPAKRQRFQ